MNSINSIPVISMYQPWAQWVMLGWKPIETRTHERFRKLQGLRFGIHASQKWDKWALPIAAPFLTEDQIEKTKEMQRTAYPEGHLLGTVECFVHRRLTVHDSRGALIECITPRWGLFLQDREVLERPFPVAGHQGIWKFQIPEGMEFKRVEVPHV